MLLDDKSEHAVPFILERLEAQKRLRPDNVRPFFLGLNGVQGVGKTTLVSRISIQDPHTSAALSPALQCTLLDGAPVDTRFAS